VRDEDQAHPPVCHQPVENAQYVELHRHIERRSRLVRDQQFGSCDQHHGDHRALAHASRNLMRIEIVDAFHVADLHRFEHGERALPRLRLADGLVCAQRLDDLPADAHDRIQRIFWVLQDHRDALAPELAELPGRGVQQVDALELQPVCRNLGAGGR
jgi:hypothetical protein